jgi:hypothetical protein
MGITPFIVIIGKRCFINVINIFVRNDNNRGCLYEFALLKIPRCKNAASLARDLLEIDVYT